jgi:hypothetical protein
MLTLPLELLTNIFEFLLPLELLNVAECSKLWFIAVSKDKQLWEPHAKNIWNRFEFNKPDLENIDLLKRIKKIPLVTLKRFLMRIDLSRCIEKLDFQRMMLSKLLFQKKSLSNRSLRVYYPEWALKIGVFKASYFYSVKEVKRTEIMMSELCQIHWAFHFKRAEFPDNVEWTSSFLPDYTMKSDLNEQSYTWQV